MDMIKLTPTEEGLIIKSSLPVDDSFVNKLENPINNDRVHAHLKDIKATHEIKVEKNTPWSILSMTTWEEMSVQDFACTLKVLHINHNSFLENVGRMPEVQFKVEEETTDEGNEKISAVTDLLKSIDLLEPDECVVITDRIGFIGIALGEINVSLLREILDTYVDKHMSK